MLSFSATSFLPGDKMIRMLYSSLAAPSMTAHDLDKILISARRNNQERNVTGVLVSGGGVFLQILEGPQESVLSLYLKILGDKRHFDVELMRATPIIDRLFGEWSMAAVEATPVELAQIMKFRHAHFAFDEQDEFLATMRGIHNLLKAQKKASALPADRAAS